MQVKNQFNSFQTIRQSTSASVVLFTAIIAASVLGCTRKQENGSQVIVRLPASTQSESKDHFSKIAKLEAMSSADWGVAHPASLAETKCFAVVVELPEDSTSTTAPQQCTIDTAPEKNITVSQFAGLAPAGSEIELNVASGPNRTFHLFAFAAESSGECQITTVGSLIRKSSLSGPLHIGSKKANIVAGVNNIEITGSFATSTAYDNCEWQTPPPLTGGNLAINSGANYTNNLLVTVSNTLPFIASEVYYTTSSTCSTGGVWEAYAPTKSGFSLSAGDGPKSIYAKFRDSSGSVSSCLSNAIILDQTAPVVTIVPAPDVNALSATNFGFNGTCTDDGLAINWTIGGVNGSTACSAGIYTVSAIDLSSVADGPATLSVATTDLAGNVGNGSDTIVKDVAVPTVTITQPITSSVINAAGAANLLVNGTCSDNGAAVNLTLGGTVGSANCAGGVYSTNVNVVAEVDGSLQIAAEISDIVGNIGSSSVIVSKDTIPPTAVITGVPNSIVLGTSVAMAVDPGDVIQYRYAISSVTQTDCMDPMNYSGPLPVATPLDISTPTPARHFICVVGIDAAGNQQSVSAPTIESLTKGPVTISFSQHWSSAPESVGFRNLAIDIFPILSTPINLDLEVKGTAISGTHYTGYLNGRDTITVPAFTSASTVDVNVIGSSVGNFERRLSVSLKGSPNTAGVQIGFNQTHEVWIEDSAAAPNLLQKISAGPNHSCGITNSGKLFCWGSDANGSLGNGGSNTDESSPVPIDVSNTYLEISVNNFSTCGIRTDQTLWCWGANNNGMLGLGDTTSRTSPNLVGNNYIKVSLGTTSTCAVSTSGELRCWGNQLDGRLGNGIGTGNALTPQTITSISPIADVSVGFDHACAVRTDGQLFCWGRNILGQVGDGSTNTRLNPAAVSLVSPAIQVSAGTSYTCAVLSTGKAFCWGSGVFGNLGQGSATNSSVPIAAHPSFDFLSIQAGNQTTCAVSAIDSRLKCWGSGTFGLLGDGVARQTSFTPVDVRIPSTTTAFSSRGNTACAVSAGYGICWGGNNLGQTGGGFRDRLPLIELTPTVDFSQLSLGRGGCGITPASKLWCWGANDFNYSISTGQVGDGTTHPRNGMVHVDPTESYSDISFGVRHTCGITLGRELKCWGYNLDGQLGTGDTLGHSSPRSIGFGYSTVSVGFTSTCAINLANKLFCWGSNSFGQLGTGNNTNRLLPEPVMPAVDFQKVSVGASSTCAITVGLDLYCWGRNNVGQIGNASTVDTNTPFFVAPNVLTTSAGSEVNCFVNSTNQLYCMGRNGAGEMGLGSATPSQYLTPSLVGNGYIDVRVGKNTSGGGVHVCGRTTANLVNCWGSNSRGQNHPLVGNVLSPVQIDAGAFIAVETGEWQTCVRSISGNWRCRGLNEDSQIPTLGFSSTIPSLLPRIRY